MQKRKPCCLYSASKAQVSNPNFRSDGILRRNRSVNALLSPQKGNKKEVKSSVITNIPSSLEDNYITKPTSITDTEEPKLEDL